MTLHEKPPNATHWSGRSMAAAAGISLSSVHRIWRAHGLKPHLVKTFKVSRDKNFAAKVTVGQSLKGKAVDALMLDHIEHEPFTVERLERSRLGLIQRGVARRLSVSFAS